MPKGMDQEARNRVSVAVSAALRLRGLTHEDVARKLGKSVQTVRNKISVGGFTEKMAREWSEALDIPYETFMPGSPDPGTDERIAQLENELEALRKVVDELRAALGK